MALGAQQQVKIWKTGQLSCHYIAEISLNVTLNHNQSILARWNECYNPHVRIRTSCIDINFNLGNNLKLCQLVLSYFTCVFLVARPFTR